MAFIEIKLRSFDSEQLDKCCGEIVSVALKYNQEVSGPIPLPTNKKRFVVNRSPHIDKNSREILNLHVHKRLLKIKTDVSSGVMQSLEAIEIKPGIDINVEVTDDKLS